MNNIDERLVKIDKELREEVKNSYFCNMCELNHNEICFFAYECLKNKHIHLIPKK